MSCKTDGNVKVSKSITINVSVIRVGFKWQQCTFLVNPVQNLTSASPD